MKTKVILVFVVVILCAVKSDLMGQATAVASTSATVITPIGLVKNVDMSFGNASVSSTTGGSVVLTPAGTRSTGGSGVTLPATSGSVAAANFTVSGAASYTYAITLPGSVVVNGPAGATMTVSSFTSVPSSSGTLGTGGSQMLNVGATLNISAAQAAGSYSNPSGVPVTVNYN